MSVYRPSGFRKLASVAGALAIAAVVSHSGATPAAQTRSDAAVDPHLLDALNARLIGPNSPSGRVWQITGVRGQPNTLYICTCQGGVWRTNNYGATITPIFDEENGASCGAVAIAPSNPDHIWVGTGGPAQRQSNALGYGVFKSTDGGKTWQHLGLERTEQIGDIIITRATRTSSMSPRSVISGSQPRTWRLQDDERWQVVGSRVVRRRHERRRQSRAWIRPIPMCSTRRPGRACDGRRPGS